MSATTINRSDITRKGYIKAYRKTSRAKEIWDVFSNNRTALLGLFIIVVFVVLALFANVIADYETVAIKTNPVERFTKPCAEHIFGTDELGRDIFARIIHGARVSLRLGVLSVMVGTALSCIIGAIAGYVGGVVDDLVMRAMDIMACIPRLVLAIAIVAAFGSSEVNLVLAMGISTVAAMSRVVRSAVMSVRDMEYIEAARALGQSTTKIIVHHILVNCVAPIIVQATLAIATNIMSISSLSFLGMGIAAPIPEWGCMVAGARDYMRQHPYLVIAPGMSILLSAMAFNLVGDGLRDALDPKLKR